MGRPTGRGRSRRPSVRSSLLRNESLASGRPVCVWRRSAARVSLSSPSELVNESVPPTSSSAVVSAKTHTSCRRGRRRYRGGRFLHKLSVSISFQLTPGTRSFQASRSSKCAGSGPAGMRCRARPPVRPRDPPHLEDSLAKALGRTQGACWGWRRRVLLWRKNIPLRPLKRGIRRSGSKGGMDIPPIPFKGGIGFSEDSLGLPERETPVCLCTGVSCGASRD